MKHDTGPYLPSHGPVPPGVFSWIEKAHDFLEVISRQNSWSQMPDMMHTFQAKGHFTYQEWKTRSSHCPQETNCHFTKPAHTSRVSPMSRFNSRLFVFFFFLQAVHWVASSQSRKAWPSSWLDLTISIVLLAVTSWCLITTLVALIIFHSHVPLFLFVSWGFRARQQRGHFAPIHVPVCV